MPITNSRPSGGRPLSLSEEKAIDREIQELESERDGAEIVQGVSHQAHDRKKVLKRLSELKAIKESRGVQKAIGSERDQVERELNSLTEELQVGMPDYETYTMTRKKHGMAYIDLKRWIMKAETDPIRKQKIQRWKWLRRRLEPNDPDFAKTIYLFPQR